MIVSVLDCRAVNPPMTSFGQKLLIDSNCHQICDDPKLTKTSKIINNSILEFMRKCSMLTKNSSNNAQNSWNCSAGQSSLLKKWHTSVIIQEISFSNLEKGKMSPEFSRRVDSSECYWHKCVLGLLKVPVNIHVVTLSVSTWSSDSNDPPKLTMGKNHEELYHLLHGELCVAVDWFRNNGMLTNPEKFKSMILGLTNLDFTFVIDGIII